MAATLLGCVQPIMPKSVKPASCKYCVSWVVLPDLMWCDVMWYDVGLGRVEVVIILVRKDQIKIARETLYYRGMVDFDKKIRQMVGWLDWKDTVSGQRVITTVVHSIFTFVSMFWIQLVCVSQCRCHHFIEINIKWRSIRSCMMIEYLSDGHGCYPPRLCAAYHAEVCQASLV